MTVEKIYERDTMFAKFNYKNGSEAYKDYYSKNQDKKQIDDSFRNITQLCGEESITYNKLNSPIAECPFNFLGDIINLCEGDILKEKVEANPEIFSKKIKGIAKQYGTSVVGITKLKNKYIYSHRLRHEENYCEEINLNHEYAKVFGCEMNKDMINRSPIIVEVIETSKCYVDAAIIGMIISYYIRSLGYDTRNHMDGNYLVIPTLIAK